MLHKIKFLAALLVLVGLMLGCGLLKNITGTDSNKQEPKVEKQQGTSVTKGTEYQESDDYTGSNVDESKSTADLKAPASTNVITTSGTYPNGEKGYRTVIAPGDLTDGIDSKRQEGITKDGIYYYRLSDVEQSRPKNHSKESYPFGIGGPMFLDKASNEWQYKAAGITVVDKVEFYFVQAPDGKPIPEKNGNYRMCGWYMDSDYYYPHEGVKRGISKVIANTVR